VTYPRVAARTTPSTFDFRAVLPASLTGKCREYPHLLKPVSVTKYLAVYLQREGKRKDRAIGHYCVKFPLLAHRIYP